MRADSSSDYICQREMNLSYKYTLFVVSIYGESTMTTHSITGYDIQHLRHGYVLTKPSRIYMALLRTTVENVQLGFPRAADALIAPPPRPPPPPKWLRCEELEGLHIFIEYRPSGRCHRQTPKAAIGCSRFDSLCGSHVFRRYWAPSVCRAQRRSVCFSRTTQFE